MPSDRPNFPLSRARTVAAAFLNEPKTSRWMPWLLLLFGLLYYGSFVRSGLNLGGEGGTAAVIAMRLMEGQRPIVDTFLGYNVLWFFPVAWLFEITGPNYLALRCYFFAFCLASGLLVYLTVHRYTKNAWFSAVPAVLALMIPGMLFRNYMPFLGALNAWLLTRAFLDGKTGGIFLRRASMAGIGLGATFLFRIDLGIFQSVIFAGLAVLHPLARRSGGRRAAVESLAASLLAIAAVLIVHAPFLIDAKARNYDEAFIGQYSGWAQMVQNEWRLFVESHRTASRQPPSIPVSEPSSRTEAASDKTKSDTWEDRGALARAPLAWIWSNKKWPDRSLALATYLPIALSVPAVFVGSLLLLVAIIRRDEESKRYILYPLTVLGCSLTLFPQYFFFRPDTVHIAEMMVPMFAAVALILWALGRGLQISGPFARTISALYATALVTWMAIYISHAMPKASAGTIAARAKATARFHGLNGVDVRVRKREAIWLAGLQHAVTSHSAQGEYVLCLPYSPTINFMANRPSPLHNLYVDNATAGAEFDRYFQSLMETTKPAVVVVDQRPINKNEASRFKNWAPVQYRWLQENYVYVGRYFRNEVFARPDKADPQKAPEAVEVSD